MKKTHDELDAAGRYLAASEFPEAWALLCARLNTWMRWRTERFPECTLDVETYRAAFSDGVAMATGLTAEELRGLRLLFAYIRERVAV